MDALRSLASYRPTDHRVRLAVVAVVGTYLLFLALVAGVGAWAVWGTAALVLAAAPWVFVSYGRPYLAEDAEAGIPFAWRGERAGVWATAPAGGFLLALCFVKGLGLPGALGALACPLAAVGYTALLVLAERRHEASTMLELTVAEQRFEQITDNRPAVTPPAGEATQEWTPDFADLDAG
jgi:hypothetical protein